MDELGIRLLIYHAIRGSTRASTNTSASVRDSKRSPPVWPESMINASSSSIAKTPLRPRHRRRRALKRHSATLTTRQAAVGTHQSPQLISRSHDRHVGVSARRWPARSGRAPLPHTRHRCGVSAISGTCVVVYRVTRRFRRATGNRSQAVSLTGRFTSKSAAGPPPELVLQICDCQP